MLNDITNKDYENAKSEAEGRSSWQEKLQPGDEKHVAYRFGA